jgi:hypothetical protein
MLRDQVHRQQHGQSELRVGAQLSKGLENDRGIGPRSVPLKPERVYDDTNKAMARWGDPVRAARDRAVGRKK